jgi:hypothetical protein
MNKKAIITLVAFLGVAILAVYGFNKYQDKAKKNSLPTKEITSNDSSVSGAKEKGGQIQNSASVGITYTNSKYGFSLILPEKWKDYVAVESEGKIFNAPNATCVQCAFIRFDLPLDKDNQTEQDVNKGHSETSKPAVVIQALLKKLAESKNANSDLIIGQNDRYLFVLYVLPQDPTDKDDYDEITSLMPSNPVKYFRDNFQALEVR